MHIFFSGIGGTAIGPLALIAKQAGYEVSGSDKQQSQYLDYLKKQGIDELHIGQSKETIEAVHARKPIDWIVYSSAVAIENHDHPELVFARENHIKSSKRDELLNRILSDSGKKLIAIAGTHGKTTTTAMAIWLFKQLNIPISYSVGAKIPFGEMGQFDPASEYFVYECDEFDKNFLEFRPFMSLITGIDYDHHEVFPSREDYQAAFRQFLDQSTWNVVWQDDVVGSRLKTKENYMILKEDEPILNMLSIPGLVNRKDGALVIKSMLEIVDGEPEKMAKIMNSFPGLSRRFEKITDGLYSDYAHTIPKIQGCLQLAGELSDQTVVVYEPLTDRRQHYIKDEYKDTFAECKKLYWVPSYLAREDPNQQVLAPAELIANLSNPDAAEPAELDSKLKDNIAEHLKNGDMVVCLSGGGGGSLDEWVRANFA